MNASEFLRELWTDRPPGKIQLWSLPDKRSIYLDKPFYHTSDNPDLYHAIGTTVADLGPRRRAGNDQIAALCGVYLDIDGPATMNMTMSPWEFSPPPTIVVDSGYGIHTYWLFPEPWVFRSLPDRARAASLVRRWVTRHPAADRAASDLARVLRLPGTRNCKDPANPRPVRVISSGGPRHKPSDLENLVSHIPQPNFLRTPPNEEWPVDLTGDTSAFAAKFDALMTNSPAFAAVWYHHKVFEPDADRTDLDTNLSRHDLALCSLAADAMTDAELAKLIDMHRCQWGTGDDIMKGHRTSYLEKTIAKARSRTPIGGR